MSVITTHALKPIDPNFNIINELKAKNILVTKSIYRYDRNNNVTSHDLLVVDYAACDKTQTDAELKKLKEEGRTVETFNTSEGVIEKYEAMGFTFDKAFSKENGRYRFRQEWDKNVLESLLTMPVCHKEPDNHFNENTLFWFLNYGCDEDPAFYISKAFPEQAFSYVEEMEGDIICDCIIKNGEVTEDLRLKEDYNNDAWERD